MTHTPDPELAQAARWHRREHLAVLLSRAARGVLTPKEGPLLRAAVDTELADAEDAHRRAERAEQQAANVRAYADRDLYRGPSKVDACTVRERLLQLAALDAAGQPDTPAGECGYVDGDRRCIGRPGHHNPRLVHGPWVTHTAQHAREDGHTGATGATSTTDAPGADDDANGPHAGTDGRDTYRAAFQHLLPESAWHLAGHLADAAAGLADQWTRALEQRNSRLRGELRQARAEVGQLRAKLRGALAGAGELREQRARLEAELRLARADLDHRDQTIRHLENGLRHERDIVDRVRAVAKNYPGLTALRNALADHATPGEVLPDELLRLLDMNRYVSTACDTAGACETAAADHVDDADKLHDQAVRLHTRCRRTHKFTGQPCACDCHHQPNGVGRPQC